MKFVSTILKKYNSIGHKAIVGDSRLLAMLVPIDNYFYHRLNKSGLEKYFYNDQMEEAIEFVKQTTN